MESNRTSIIVQQYLHQLADARGVTDSGPVISALLGCSARRLQVLCNALLHRSYPRLGGSRKGHPMSGTQEKWMAPFDFSA